MDSLDFSSVFLKTCVIQDQYFEHVLKKRFFKENESIKNKLFTLLRV